MRKQQTVNIEGWTYELSQLGGVEGRVLVLRFAKLLGRIAPVIAGAMKAAPGGKVPAEGVVSALLDNGVVEDFAIALNAIDANELEPLWDAFARHAQVRGRDGKTRENLHEVFDEHFAGEYFGMVRFFIESAKLNFGDFLGKALAQAGAQTDTEATP